MQNTINSENYLDQIHERTEDFEERVLAAIASYQREIRLADTLLKGNSKEIAEDKQFWQQSINNAERMLKAYREANEEVIEARKQIMSKALAKLQEEMGEESLSIEIDKKSGNWLIDTTY